MFDEVSVEIGRHRADAFVQQDLDARIGGVYTPGREHDAGSGRRGQMEEVPARHRGCANHFRFTSTAYMWTVPCMFDRKTIHFDPA